MGGGFALLLANDGFDAAAVNYGRLPERPRGGPGRRLPDRGQLRRQGPHPARRGGETRSPCSTGLGVEHDVKEFPHAGHAFLNDVETGPRALRPLFRVMGIGPDPESAPEAWQRIEDHFAKHLKP